MCEECQSIDLTLIQWEKGQAEARNGHHTLQCLPFLNTHRLWPIVFLHLEAIGEARLSKHDSSAGGGVLQAQNPYE